MDRVRDGEMVCMRSDRGIMGGLRREVTVNFSGHTLNQLENTFGHPVQKCTGFVQIVLIEPKIPQNTGNIIRLCACTGAGLTIVGEPAFSMDDAHMRRAGLDYYREISIERQPDWSSFMDSIAAKGKGWQDLVFFSRFARRIYTEYSYTLEAILVFGNEPDGLPPDLRHRILEQSPEQMLRIPVSRRCRSLNLASAVTLIVYEALRQNQFANLLLSYEEG